ncbi:MAG: V-type ATPase 116kDa subunit family protein [Sulfolobales archaeon]|nr:hypothetical protein [Sulfolobales archaeon]MDW8082382.1 V-type ATPase 116kDa subunit family protein [Sulfolobales archaeon]
MSNIKQTILSDPDVALKIVVVVPRDYVGEVTELLLKREVLEPVVLEPGTPLLREYEAYFSLLKKAGEICKYLESNIEEKIVVRVEIPQGSIKSTVESLVAVVEDIYEKVKSLNTVISSHKAELEELEAIKKLTEALIARHPDGRISLINYSGRLVVTKSLIATEGTYEQLKSKSLSVIEAVEYGKKIVASLAFSRETFNEIARTASADMKFLEIEEAPTETLANFTARLDKRITEIGKIIEEFTARKHDILKSAIRDIAVLKSLVESEYERNKILQSALSSKFVVAITGWIPRSKVDGVVKSLDSYPVYVGLLEDENPPVDFKNLAPFKPFELLTELYGIPSPHEWDPTPLLTYSFLLFFSLMMSDAGYGLGVVLATRYILPRFTIDPESPGFLRLKKILYTGGILSIVTGILSKSFLGSLIGRYIPIERPLINTFDIMKLIGLSLAIGFVFTFLSHSIALAKNVKLRRSYDAVYEIGVMLTMLGGVFVVTRVFNLGWMTVSEDLYRATLSITLIGVALVVFTKIKTMGGVGGFLWLFDIVGIVGDVFSYVRIAGIAGGTAFLAEAFNSILAGVVSSLVGLNYTAGIALGVLLALVIHTLNLALSAVSPFVHSLRLCLFEISSKFFEAQGRRIKPVKMVIGKMVV